MRKKVQINKKKLEELEKQTKEKFTKFLIEDLRKRMHSKKIGFYEKLDFERILTLIKRERNNKKLKEFGKSYKNNLLFDLGIIHRNKKRNIVVNGNIPLSKLSQLIQKEFNLEWGHLYKFEVGKFKFGPECDEWQETFDCLDNFQLGSAISAVRLKKGDFFKFLYDFGNNLKFKVQIKDITKLKNAE